MLIFGLSVKEFLLGTLVFACEVCGNTAAHHLVRRVRRFSLFFVPLFSVGTRYFDTCTACGRQREMPREQAEAAAAQVGDGGLR